MVAFLSYVTRFFQPIQELSRMYTTLQSAMAGGEQVLKLLDTAPEVLDQPERAGDAADPGSHRPSITSLSATALSCPRCCKIST